MSEDIEIIRKYFLDNDDSWIENKLPTPIEYHNEIVSKVGFTPKFVFSLAAQDFLLAKLCIIAGMTYLDEKKLCDVKEWLIENEYPVPDGIRNLNKDVQEAWSKWTNKQKVLFKLKWM